MPRIIQSVHLSDYQARVMLIAHQAQTPELAYEELGSQDKRIEPNMLGARDTLAKIGLLEVGDNYIAVTPKGEEVMKDEYLIDEMGQPTERGEELLQQHSDEEPPAQQGPNDPQMDQQQGLDNAPVTSGGEQMTSPGDGFPAEGSIFRQVHDLSRLLKG